MTSRLDTAIEALRDADGAINIDKAFDAALESLKPHIVATIVSLVTHTGLPPNEIGRELAGKLKWAMAKPPAPETTQARGARDDSSRYYATPLFPIASGTGLLGASINGAMPDPAFGFWLEWEGNAAPEEAEVTENMWVRVATSRDNGPQTGRGDHLVFASDARKIERLFAAIVEASTRRLDTVTMPDKYDGYRNHAQSQFDENARDDGIENLTCRVMSRQDGSFEVYLGDEAKVGEGPVARLNGKLAPEHIVLLQTEFAKFREARDEAMRDLNKVLEAGQSSAPAP